MNVNKDAKTHFTDIYGFHCILRVKYTVSSRMLNNTLLLVVCFSSQNLPTHANTPIPFCVVLQNLLRQRLSNISSNLPFYFIGIPKSLY